MIDEKKYYKSQQEHWSLEDNSKADTWALTDTLDWWRHKRMYDCLLPALTSSKNHTWLTIGDGKLARDAQYLMRKGVNVTASDIETKYLKLAKKKKLITGYRKINAEKINLKDNSFDYVLCKESCHHFPRPCIAIYEMLRVAKNAVVLIEPQDTKAMITRKYNNSFETSGNYVYGINKREIEKIALAIGLRAVAFKQIDDIYINDVENVKYNQISKEKVIIYSMLSLMNLLHQVKLRQKNMLVAFIFKTKPNKRLVDGLIDDEFNYLELPVNPYIK